MTETVLRLLGDAQLRVIDDDGTARTVSPQPGKVTGLLGVLALNAGKVVTIERLVDELWPEEAPDSARASVHVNISRLRRHLDGTDLRITTRSPGYALEGPVDAIDVHVFERALQRAQVLAEQQSWLDVVQVCEQAQELWRGEPFATTTIPVLSRERDHLIQQRQSLVEAHCRGLLELGRAEAALPLARSMREAEPYAEFGAWALMKALWETGRAAAALEAFESYRRTLAEDLGLDPGPNLVALHLDVLRGGDVDPADLAAPVPTARPQAAQPIPEPVPAPASEPGPDRDDSVGSATNLVGRRAELRELEDAVRGVTKQRPAVVFLEGDAGIGKTVLARHAATRAQEEGVRVVWARAVDGMAMPPLSMWKRVLGDLGLDVDIASARPGEDEAFTFYDSLVDRIFGAVATEPLVIVLDDVQWADDGTLQVLQLLANRMWNEQLVIVATRRPKVVPLTAPGATALDRIAREQVTRVLRLAPFTTEELRAAGVVERDMPALMRRTGGNPFLVQELLRDGSAGDPQAVPNVPSGVRAIVQARTLALPAKSRDVLSAAAVAGRTFDLSWLADVFDATVPEIAEALQPAVDDGLLVVDTHVPAWSFKHDLVREALLSLQTAQQRSGIHARLADAIEKFQAEDLGPFLPDLALHRFEAALGQQSMAAFEACTRAADEAAAGLAFDRACHHRARALAALPRTPENRILRFSCLRALTRERRRVGDVVGAASALDEAQRVADALGDDALIRDAVTLLGGATLWNWRQFEQVDRATVSTLDRLLEDTTDPVPRAELLGTLGVELYYGEDRLRGVEAARAAVDLARETGEVELVGRTLNNLTIATWSPEHRNERRRAVEDTLDLAGRGLPLANEAIARLHRAPLLLREGRIGDARADLARAEWLAPRLGLPEIEAQVATQLAGIAMLEGDQAWAEESIERAHDILSRTSFWGARWIRQVQRFTLHKDRGTTSESLEELLRTASEDAFRMLRWTAVLGLAECDQTKEARAMQRRWGLTRPSTPPYWNSDFDDTQAGMVAVLLGVPDPQICYQRLTQFGGSLAVAGTGLGVWGPVDDVLADLADTLGRPADAARHRRDAAALRRVVEDELMGADVPSA